MLRSSKMKVKQKVRQVHNPLTVIKEQIKYIITLIIYFACQFVSKYAIDKYLNIV